MKRTFDLATAAVALILLAPVMLLVALLILATMGRPVFFRQTRVGRNDALFPLLKFRTMSGPDPGHSRHDAARLTPFGSCLRRLSVDELPQLWNVLRGEMSLVGPRPLLPQYLPRYNARQRRRHEVKPGITGWAQVNGRNALTWERKLELDVWYVEHRSFPLDLRILWMTVLRVVRREGIAQAGCATMPEFMGNGR